MQWPGERFRGGRFSGRFARGPWGPGWEERLGSDFAEAEAHPRVPRRLRLLLPVFISLFVQLPGVFIVFHTGSRPELASHSPLDLAFHLGLALIGPLSLLGARRFPGPVVAIVSLAASVDILTASQSDGPPYIALAFAIGSAIVRGARVWAWVSIAVSWAATLVLASVIGIDWQPGRVVGITFGILLLVGLAEGIRTGADRRAHIQRVIQGRRQAELQQERVRIARELHDVLAHSLSQINVQAGVGLHLIDKQPQKAAEALASIKQSSKTALDEVRSVLGILRAEDGADPSAPLVPEPDLSRLAGLAASVTSQGVAVTLSDTLTGVDKPTQLAMYRIVQESLTNVVRHANATSAVVTLAEAEGRYTVTIRDNGVADAHSRGAVSEGGRGLLGMRERAELLGGKLEAGRQPGGGFLVSATIPKRNNPNEESPR